MIRAAQARAAGRRLSRDGICSERTESTGFVSRIGEIAVRSATMSTWRLQPVFSKTPRTWVRIVFNERPPSAAMSCTVFPDARPRATRASVGVRSNKDCTSSTGGACGRVTGVSTSTAAQRTKMSRADKRMGTICATIMASAPGIADREGAHGAARQIDCRDRLSKQWAIYDASPSLPFTFPRWMTLGGWLAGSIAWHISVMCVLFVDGSAYLRRRADSSSHHRIMNATPLAGALGRGAVSAVSYRARAAEPQIIAAR
jgi:hypothetical protein